MVVNRTSFVFLCIGLAAGFVLSAVLSGRPDASSKLVVERCDTVTVVDTHFIDVPMVVDIEISEDSMEVPVSDIIIRKDSIVVLPMEVRTYEGDGYRAQISGYRPHLDWIQLYPTTKYVTEQISVRKPMKRWGIGLQSGYGFVLNSGHVMHGPYVGIGISYNLLFL